MEYTSLSTKELATELELRADKAPIDMGNVEVSARSLSHVLSDCDDTCEHELRSVAIGHLMLLDALSLDMSRKPIPRAEDGDIIFANRSWVPGKVFDELLQDLAIASREAARQRRLSSILQKADP